ncbi:MAG: polymer-forming cytoskeletal protein, partial [Spirochaetaceae bacterium]|nr:polymer-forming cytoskeletal protein [Spirochaetaceae bacterium]
IIFGNIYTPRLIVEEGVILHGNCTIKSNYAENVDLLKDPGTASVSNVSNVSNNKPEIKTEIKNDGQKIENSDSPAKSYSSAPYGKELDEKTLSENITRGPLL